jgi:ribosomal-protein-alanine N-acetyltransferase
MPLIRPGDPQDLAAVAAIQESSPEAAHWNPADYLQYDFRVCVHLGHVAGFLVARHVVPDESEVELLNLAVAPEFRGKGLGRALLGDLLATGGATVFLEVRESNQAARNLYKSTGFKEVNIRPQYYPDPPEAAIVMKFHSC